MRSGRSRVGAIIGAALLLAALHEAPVLGAMRVCGQVIAGAGEDRSSERLARKRAFEQWMKAAAAIGPAFTRWQLAVGRSVSCLTLGDGTHRCQAYGQPCGISQVPGKLPPGTNETEEFTQRRLRR